MGMDEPDRQESCFYSLLTAAMARPFRARQESLSRWSRCRKAGCLISSDTSEAKIQDFSLSHPPIYSVVELLVYLKGLVLQDQKLQDLYDTWQQPSIQEEFQ